MRIAHRIGVACVMAGLVAAAAEAAQADRPAPPAAQADRPAPPVRPADLLKATPFDRVTLIDGTVLHVDPISPRPLPPYDPKRDRKADPKDDRPPPEGNVFLPSQKDLIAKAEAAKRAETEVIRELNLTPVGEDQVYRVRRASLRSVEYFEDMLIAEGIRLAAAHDFARAFEHLLRVRERAGTWAGLDAGARRLLFEEGTLALGGGDAGRGLRLLRELHAQEPGYPGLADALATAYGGRVESAFGAGAYAEARRILHELEGLSPGHPAIARATEAFVKAARAKADVPADAGAAARLDGLAEALRIWPKLEGGEARYREAFAALPTLDVAVPDVARPVGPWRRTPAEARVAGLLYRPLLASGAAEALSAPPPGGLLAAVEVGDLGRRWTLALREGIPWSDGSGNVSARDLVRGLGVQADPRSPRFAARWAGRLARVSALDESRVEVTLTRPVLRPAAWLTGTIGPAHAGRDGRVPGPDGTRVLVGSGPFRLVEDGEARLVAVAPGPDAGIRRVRERRYDRPDLALKAFRAGEVAMLDGVPPWEVPSLAADADIRVGRDPVPRTHVLALDGRVPALRNRSLRRGISYAIARREILEETLLRRRPAPPEGAADGLILPGTYADVAEADPLPTDPLLARMLVAAARKELGVTELALTLQYPAIPEAVAAVPRIAEALTAAGLAVKLVARPPDALEHELRAGATFDLAYRVVRCDEPIEGLGPALCPGYDAPPDRDALAAVASPRTLETLLKLEQASEFPTARALAIRIDRETRDELAVVPLWRLFHHVAWRSRLTGPAAEASTLYEGIESWRIEPWIARDPW
jgi:peptide/nickel transport system substrate-binding protein